MLPVPYGDLELNAMNIKLVVLVLSLALVMLSACTIEHTKYVCWDGKETSDSSQCSKPEKEIPTEYGNFEILKNAYEECDKELTYYRKITNGGDYIEIELNMTKDPIASPEICAESYKAQQGKDEAVICKLNTIYRSQLKILMGCWCQYEE